MALSLTRDELRLRLYPDPVLKQKAQPVQTIDGRVRDNIARMFEIMYEEQGIGLAAPQVGWLERVFVVNITADPEQSESELVFINPMLNKSGDLEKEDEGCLSLPEIQIPVPRPPQITVVAFDLNGQEFSFEAEGLLARCIQHELDHLDGVLITRYMTDFVKLRVGRRLKELESRYSEESRG